MRHSLTRTGLFLLPLAAVLLAAQPAAACTCAGRAPGVTIEQATRGQMAEADAAFVGRLLEMRPVGRQPGDADFLYRVQRVYKGKRRLRRGRVVTVRSDRTTCGLPDKVGRRYGLLLDRRRGRPRWESGLCSVVRPRELDRASRGETAAEAGCGVRR